MSDINPSRGGLVFYRETQDDLLFTRATNEVRTAFPNHPTFTPVSLFIATWLQVPPVSGDGVSLVTSMITTINYSLLYRRILSKSLWQQMVKLHLSPLYTMTHNGQTMVRMVLLHWLESMVVIIMVRSVALPGSSSNDNYQEPHNH